MFFIIFLTVLGLMHGYVGWCIFKGLDIKANYKILAIALVVIFTLLPVLPIAFRYIGYESSLLDVLSLIGYTGLGFFFLTFLLFITKDIVTKSWSVISSFFSSFSPHSHLIFISFSFLLSSLSHLFSYSSL